MYTNVVRAGWLVLGLTRVVLAQPSTIDPNDVAMDACKARRHELRVAAMKLRLAERGPKLVMLPECRRLPDGTTQVIDPTAQPVLPPFTPALSIALVTGIAATRVTYPLDVASSFGPYVQLEGGWHFVRRISIGAFAAYTGFDDGSYLGHYDVRHRIYDVGARIRVHVGDGTVGVGLGVEIDNALAFADVPATSTPNLLIAIDARLPIMHVGRFELIVDAIVSYSAASETPTADVSIYGDVLSARLAIGLRL